MGHKLILSSKIISLGIAITVCFSFSLAWVHTKHKTSTYDVKTREFWRM